MYPDWVTYYDFLAQFKAAYANKQFDQRFGQAYFNALYQVRPEIADTIRGSRLDPFHKNYVPAETEMFVQEAWNA
jgi:hypothetical protein